jgi:ATP-dependent DNA ligase
MVRRVLDLERLCEQCKDPKQRVIGRIEVGQKFHMQSSVPAGAQDAKRNAKKGKPGASDTDAVKWIIDQIHKRYPRSRFLVECKFDGWRICLHVPDIAEMETARFASDLNSPISQPPLSTCL